MADDARPIRVEVVRAEPSSVARFELSLPAGSSVAFALEEIRAGHQFTVGTDIAAVGIFGRRVEAGHVLEDGDRLELYRALRIDPKEARRKRAGKLPR